MQSITKNDISYRKKYTYYYMITLAIPVVVLLFVNILTQNIVRQQVIASNNRILTQFFYRMDEKLQNAQNDAMALVLDPDMAEVAKLDRSEIYTDYRKKAELIAQLNRYYHSGAYEDVFIWLPDSGYVISGANPVSGSVTVEKYCADYYAFSSMPDQIKQMAHANVLRPVLWQIEQGANRESSLGITMHHYDSYSNLQDHVVTIVIGRDFFSKELGDGILLESDHVMLFSRNGRQLFSYRDNKLEKLPENCRESGIYDIEVAGDQYTLLVQESETTDGFYAMPISQDAFYEPLTKIRTVSFAGIILSLFLGFLTVGKMIRNTYQPLEEILEKIESAVKKPFAGQKKNEFAFISEIISSWEEEQQNDRLQKQQENDAAKRKHLLLAVLEGRETKETDIEQLEIQYRQGGSFLVCALSLKDCGNVGWDLLPYIVKKEFSDCLASLCMYEILSVTSANYAIILWTGESDREPELLDALQKGIAFLKQKCEVNAVLGISTEGKEVAGLYRLYRQATQALNYKFMKPAATVIQYRDIKERRFSLPFGEKTALFHAVKAFLQEEQSPKGTAEEFVAQLAELYGLNAEASIQNVEYFRYEMSNALKGILLGSDLADSGHQSNIDSLADAGHLEGYLQKLTEVLDGIKADLKETSQRQLLSAKIKKYVEQHYFEVELSVSMIGDVFGMQAAYLSQMFRECYGTRLVNYIAYVRVDRAKQLLSDTDLSIREIAAQVGFLSSGVFIKTFKKELGITPGQYRTSNTAL